MMAGEMERPGFRMGVYEPERTDRTERVLLLWGEELISFLKMIPSFNI